MINHKKRSSIIGSCQVFPIHIQIKKKKHKIPHLRKALSLQLIDAQLNIFK